MSWLGAALGRTSCLDESHAIGMLVYKILYAASAAMDVATYYQELLARRAILLNECIADPATFAMHVVSHNMLKDLDEVQGVLAGEERIVFMQACREYQYSLEAAIVGNYRHAFSSLRLSFELFTASIYFSAHQMKMNLWLAGTDDLYWASLIDPDKGVYSHNFMKAFNPELIGYRIQYMNLATQVYRECSEYVHGNPGTHENLTRNVSYDAPKLQNFHDKIKSVRICVLFQFISRYLREMSLENKIKIEGIIVDSFGDLPEIQAEFGVAGK